MDQLQAPRRSHGDSSSSSPPEFEFWMVGNHPELESGDIHTADELFVDGVILPLHLLSLPNPTPKPEDPSSIKPESRVLVPEPISAASIMSAAPIITASKRWTDIFKKSSSSSSSSSGAEEKDKDKVKKERKGFSGNNGGSGTELNIINIWPFSRSRSAGTGRPKPAPSPAPSKSSSSAPCSRSNSRGEGGRRWAASPARAGGVHVGRASPVWQVRPKGKAGGGGGPRKKVGGPRGLTVNSCIGGGYRGHVTCRGEEVGAANASLFRFRALFTSN